MKTVTRSPRTLALRSLLTALVLWSVLWPQSGPAAAADEPTKPAPGTNATDRLGELVTIPAGRFLMGNNGRNRPRPTRIPAASRRSPRLRDREIRSHARPVPQVHRRGRIRGPALLVGRGLGLEGSERPDPCRIERQVQSRPAAGPRGEAPCAGTLGRRAGMDRARPRPPAVHPDRPSSRGGRDLLRGRSVLQMGRRKIADRSGVGKGRALG